MWVPCGRQARNAQQEDALHACRIGCKVMLRVRLSSRGTESRVKLLERYLQLSEDLSTPRWSWADFLLVDEITDVRLSPSNPLMFYVKYAPLTSASDDEVLTLETSTVEQVANDICQCLPIALQPFSPRNGTTDCPTDY